MTTIGDLSELDFPLEAIGSGRDYVVGERGSGKTDLLRLVVAQHATRTGERVKVIASPEHAPSWHDATEAHLAIADSSRMVAGRLRGAGPGLVVLQLSGSGPSSTFLPELRSAIAERAGMGFPFLISARCMHRRLVTGATVWQCDATHHDRLPETRWVTNVIGGHSWIAPPARVRTP